MNGEGTEIGEGGEAHKLQIKWESFELRNYLDSLTCLFNSACLFYSSFSYQS